MAVLVLFFLPLVGAFLRPAHQCVFRGSVYYTDCCDYGDIRLCSDTFCFTAVGCRVCDNSSCWPSPAPGVSLRPGTGRAWSSSVCGHLSVHSWAAWVAGLAGLGEVYGLGLVAANAFYILRPGGVPDLTCDKECAWPDLVYPELGTVVSELVEWLVTLPVRLYDLLSVLAAGQFLLVALLVLEGRWPLGVALVLYQATFCVGGFPLLDQCTPRGCSGVASGYPCHCPNGYWWGRPPCRTGSPSGGVTGMEAWLPCPRPFPPGSHFRCVTGGWYWDYTGGQSPNHSFSSLCTAYHRGACPTFTCLYDVRPAACRRAACYSYDCEVGLNLRGDETCVSGPRLSRDVFVPTYIPWTATSPSLKSHFVRRPGHGGLVPSTVIAALQGVALPTLGVYKGILWGAYIRNGTWPLGLWRALPGSPLDCHPSCRDIAVPVPRGYAWVGLRTDSGALLVKAGWQYSVASLHVPLRFLSDYWCLAVCLLMVARARLALLIVVALTLWARGGGVLAAPAGFWVPVVDTLPEDKYCAYVPDLDAYYCTASDREIRAILCSDDGGGVSSPTPCTPWLAYYSNVTHECHWLAFSNTTACFQTALGDLSSGFSSVWRGIKHLAGGVAAASLYGGSVAVNAAARAANATLSAFADAVGWLGGGFKTAADAVRASGVVPPFRTDLYAHASPAVAISAGPLLGSALRYPTVVECVLAFALAYLYMRFRGPSRLVAVLALRLTRNLGVLLLICVVVLGRSSRSVLGYEFCLDLTFRVEADPSPWAYWLLATVIAVACLQVATFTPRARAIKLLAYSRWAWLYSRVQSYVEFGIGEQAVPWLRIIWIVCCMIWLDECVAILFCFTLVALAFDITDMVFESLLISSPCVGSVALVLERLALLRNKCGIDWLLERARHRGVFLYEHRGDVPWRAIPYLRELQATLEPASISPQDLEIVRDTAGILECGRALRGKPVVARRGHEVIVGNLGGPGDLPPGFELCAPLVVKKAGKGVWATMLTSVLGKDKAEYRGNVYILGTAATRSMGTVVGPVMYTTWHSSQGRTMAGPTGPLNPRWWSVSDDSAAYPPPLGSSPLEPCNCGSRSAWLLRCDGALCHGEIVDREFRLDVSGRVRQFKGSSGGPILCDCGHARGITVSVLHRGPDVFAAKFVVPWKKVPRDVEQPHSACAPPPVPAKGSYEERPLFLQTGAGKSTTVPITYSKMGHRVLVLNPSVATTAAMGPYIQKLTGVHPSVYAGHGSTVLTRRTDSPLTYCTYGRFGNRWQDLLRSHDVVICDECHSHDPTVILGIGRVIREARKSGVQLVLFATATPPGAQVVPHPRITEVALNSEGDIPFYGFRLPVTRYQRGRHCIFVHSKNEAHQLATRLTAAGCKAMYHYSGRDVSGLPTEGDLVLVTTDALSTGYTGNFDTVTDCCVAVTEEVEVDLDPTITISLRTRPCGAGLRMQRRGRCGRGTAGTYYYTLATAPPSGTVESGAVWAAAEAAVKHYDMREEESRDLLEAYAECPYTSHISVHIPDATRFMAVLRPYAGDPEVGRAEDAGFSFPLLTGIQRRWCIRNETRPPSGDPRWAGIAGSNAVPLLFRFGTHMPDFCTHDPLADALSRALGDSSTHCGAGPILLVGLAAAAAVAIGDYTGSLAVVAEWSVLGGGGTPVSPSGARFVDGAPGGSHQRDGAGPPPPGPEARVSDSDVLEALNEVITNADWTSLQNAWSVVTDNVAPAAHAAACSARAWYDQHFAGFAGSVAASLRGGVQSGQPPVGGASAFLGQARTMSEALLQQVGQSPLGIAFVKAWQALIGNVGATVSLVCAAWSAGRSPPLACTSSLLLGLQTGLPLELRLPASLIAGALGTFLGSPETGLGMLGSFLVGGGVGSLGPVKLLLDVLGGWEATATAASFTFDLLRGKAAWADVPFLLPCVGAPGPALAGAAIGAILFCALWSAPGSVWFNRLLSMVPRGSVLPDGYFVEEDVKNYASDLLKRMSISRACLKVLAAVNLTYETRTEGSLFWDVVAKLVEAARIVVDYVGAYIKDRMPALALPLLGCQTGYTGPWTGSGGVSCRCVCGAVISARFENGECVSRTVSSRTCRARFSGGFPINTRGSSTGPQPSPDLDGHDCVYPLSARDWVLFRRLGDWVEVRGVTCYDTTRQDLRAAARLRAVMVDGATTTFRGAAEAPVFSYGIGAHVMVDGVVRQLPFVLRVPTPAAVRQQAYVPPTTDELDSVSCPSTLVRAAEGSADEQSSVTVSAAETVRGRTGNALFDVPLGPLEQRRVRVNDSVVPGMEMTAFLPTTTRLITQITTVPVCALNIPPLNVDTPVAPSSSQVTSRGYEAGVSGTTSAPSVTSSLDVGDSASVLAEQIDWVSPHPANSVLYSIDHQVRDARALEGAMGPSRETPSDAELRELCEAIVEPLTVQETHEALAGAGALDSVPGSTSPSMPPLEDDFPTVGTPIDRVMDAVATLGIAVESSAGASRTTAGSSSSGSDVGGPQVIAIKCPDHKFEVSVLISSPTTTLAEAGVLAGVGAHANHAYYVRNTRRRPRSRALALLRDGGCLEVRCRNPTTCKAYVDRSSGDVRPNISSVDFLVTIKVACHGEDRTFTCAFPPHATVAQALRRAGCEHPGKHIIKCGESTVVPSDPLETLYEGGPLRIRLEYCAPSQSTETSCVASYIWSGHPLGVRQRRRVPPTRPIGVHYKADATMAYCTQMDMVGDRIDKVTVEQTEAVCDEHLLRAVSRAISAVKAAGPFPGMTYDEAVAATKPGAARSAAISVSDLKTARGKAVVADMMEYVRASKGEVPFTLTAKEEVFFKDKRTLKPPRLICYPPLEFRVVEKMIMGKPGDIAKAVMGPSYGFQYTPQQRVDVLLREWKKRRLPCAVTVDASVFDSSITAADVARETEIYAAAHLDPEGVRALAVHYAGGPMVNQSGVPVGYRNCRASGVYTTSASNSITTYLKVTAALEGLGVIDPFLLINGDDCLIICERPDDGFSGLLRAALQRYGYSCDPEVHASLDTAVACKAFVAECVAGPDRERKYFLSTDFRLVLARACSEYGDPLASAGGYTLLYPWHPITRYVLIAVILGTAFAMGQDPGDAIVCEVSGNRLSFPLRLLPSILVELHGPKVLDVRVDSAKTLTEANKSLQALKMRGLGWYRKRALALRTRLIKAGGTWALLARQLLATVSRTAPPPPDTLPAGCADQVLEAWQNPYEGFEVTVAPPERAGILGSLLMGLARMVGIRLGPARAGRIARGFAVLCLTGAILFCC